MLSTQVGDDERNQGRRHSMTALALLAISLVLVGSGSVLLESTCPGESVDPRGCCGSDRESYSISLPFSGMLATFSHFLFTSFYIVDSDAIYGPPFSQ